jgi:hypothetical protein
MEMARTARGCAKPFDERVCRPVEGGGNAACSFFTIRGIWPVCPATASQLFENAPHFLHRCSLYPNKSVHTISITLVDIRPKAFPVRESKVSP